MKKLKIDYFRPQACAGGQRSHAHAPPWWNVRSARVFTCGFGDRADQGWLNSIFSQLQGLGWVVESGTDPPRLPSAATPPERGFS